MMTKPTHPRYFKSSRHNMYKDIISNIPEGFDPEILMSVSDDNGGGGPIVDCFPNSKLVNARFPEYDICNLHQVKDDTYDCIVCDQVLEHVENPFDAVKELHRVLKSGGILFLTTVFMYPIHEHPKDYWRFSPDGLENLCKNFSETITCCGWGNQSVVKILCDRRSQKLGVPRITDPQIVPLLKKNNKETPIVTWIIVRK